jgi:putative membrane protein
MSFSDLPAVNATLNGVTAVLLCCGYYFIRRRNQAAHQKCMIAAFVTSTLFLISYLAYHAKAGTTVFKNPAWFRPWYLTLLFTHTVLAAVIVPMILVTLSRALKLRFERHKLIARWTWPIWMYVSVTGVLIYWLLYIKFPQTASIAVH